jgi:hydrogenase-4 membrane subunit HyfE
MNASKLVTLLGHGLTGWALCAATMGIGMAVTSLENTLIIHAIAAPIFFAIVSFVYFRYFNYTAPLATGLIFLALVVALDFFVVALLVTRSLDMFGSLLGTWIPFVLIFAATYLTGLLVSGRAAHRNRVQ